MSIHQARMLEHKKFLGDPLLLPIIILLLVFLALFILYPLSMLMSDSVYAPDSYSLYVVAEDAEAVQALYEGEKLQEMSVSRQRVMRVRDLEGLTVTDILGRAASTTYMADLLPAAFEGSLVAVQDHKPLLTLQAFTFSALYLPPRLHQYPTLGLITNLGSTLVGCCLPMWTVCPCAAASSRMFDMVSCCH